MAKTVVTYDAFHGVQYIGAVAYLYVLDHPTVKEGWVLTTRVVRKMVNGEFETQNTIYIPDRPVNPFIDKVE